MNEEYLPLGIDEAVNYPQETVADIETQASVDAYPREDTRVAAAEVSATATPYSFIRGLVDVRSQLRRQSWGGPTTRRSLAQKNGGVIYHYAGPAQNRGISALARLKSYADYHCRPNGFGAGATGNGIMYHIGIAEDGTKYLLRDIEEDRWHCGSWPENGTWLAVNIPIGEGQTPTEAQYRAAREVGDDWLKYKGLSRAYVKGHREVGASNCPGSIIMNGLVYPMRRGENPGGAPIPVKEQEYRLRKYNFLHVAEIPDHKQIARAATEAINAAAIKAGKPKIATYAGGNPDRVRFATGKSADAPFGECVSILVGEPVTHHVHPKVALVGKPDETDIWGSYKVYPRLGSVDAVAHFMAEISRREGLAEEAMEADYRRRLGKA